MKPHDPLSKEHGERWTAFMETLYPESDAQAARLLDEFRMVAHQVFRLSEISLESAGLSYAQYRILVSLLFCEWEGSCDGLNPSEISYQHGTSRNTISALIRNLEEEGLVERLLDDKDRRRFNITLTEKGRQKVRDHASRHIKQVDHVFSVLDAEKMETLRDLLRMLNQGATALKD